MNIWQKVIFGEFVLTAAIIVVGLVVRWIT
jgi:hypothetical protein